MGDNWRAGGRDDWRGRVETRAVEVLVSKAGKRGASRKNRMDPYLLKSAATDVANRRPDRTDSDGAL